MEKKCFFWCLCTSFMCCSALAVADNGMDGSSGSVHLSAEQIRKLDESFSSNNGEWIGLGAIEEETSSEHFNSLYANVTPGLHLDDKKHHFESFEGYAFESVGDNSHDYWMVIDEKNLELHADEITEAPSQKK